MAPPPPSSSSGILSNVFGFVSRELESFVSNATGGSSSQVHQATLSQPSASSSRVKLSKSKKETRLDDRSRSYEAPRRDDEPESSGLYTLHDLSARSVDSSFDSRAGHQVPERKTRRSDQKPIAPSSRNSMRNEEREGIGEQSSQSATGSKTPPPLPRELKRLPSFTMPGSLYPRSPSVESVSPPSSPVLEGDDRHVRFATDPSSSTAKRPRGSDILPAEEVVDELGSPSSSRRSKYRKTAEIRRRSSDLPLQSGSPLRPTAISSVQDAVRKFQSGTGEASPTILLPNSPCSPSKSKETSPAGSSQSSRANRADDFEFAVPNLPSKSYKGKGKQREDPIILDVDDPDSSGVLRIQGKERELSVAIEEHMQKERDWERAPDKERDFERKEQERRRDKERIRHLEEEVRRLRDELARRPVVHLPRYIDDPPPPPPPPPPPIGIPPPGAPTDSSAKTDALLMAARASLKHAGTPKEAPINAGPLAARTKRTGQPTVNVPSDKMAAFLNEMKTVRLRKVSSASSAPAPRPSTSGDAAVLSRSLSSDGGLRLRSKDNQRPEERGFVSLDVGTSTRSWLNNLAKAGEKRKRGGDVADDHDEGFRASVKRRYDASASNTSFGSTTSTTSATSSQSTFAFTTSASTSRTSTFDHHNASAPADSYVPPPKPATSGPQRPLIPAVDTTDLTTPSLCSDHDVDNEDDTSPDDRLPCTPPVHPAELSPQSMSSQPDETSFAPVQAPSFYIEPIRETTSQRRRYLTPPPPPAADRTPSPLRSPLLKSLAKRIPSSPLPTASPRRPKPPGRMLGKALRPPRPPIPRDLDDLDNDPLSLSNKSANAAVPGVSRSRSLNRNPKETKSGRSRSASRVSVASDRSGSRASSQRPRKDTLEEELERAHAAFEASFEQDVLESEVYSGTGQKSKKKGFLAGGGAGGIPVFMGEGYVEGIEREREHEVVLRQPAQRPVVKKGSKIAIRRRDKP